MAIRGQRFHIPLDAQTETDENPKLPHSTAAGPSPFTLVKDIKEKIPSSGVKLPEPPRLRTTETGFPAHRKRAPSKFKQRNPGRNSQNGEDAPRAREVQAMGDESLKSEISFSSKNNATFDADEERRTIDQENERRIAQMSQHEVEEAQREIYEALNPAMIERLRKRAQRKQGSSEAKDSRSITGQGPSQPKPEKTTKTVSFSAQEASPSAQSRSPSPASPQPPASNFNQDDLPPTFNLEENLARTEPKLPPSSKIRPQPPDLDPSSDTFLNDLHETYFPNLPTNPATLSWMQPLSSDPSSPSSYSPTLTTLPPSSIRFDFSARLLPPSIAALIPPTSGLHHHSSAPEAAGYTVPELAHLARSSVPAQKCMAMQTLGRVLYKLGVGEYGRGLGHEGKVLEEGLWECVKRGRVLDTLVEAAAREEVRTAWVVGNEAVWLWRRGGGREV